MSDTEILEGNVVISKFMGGYMRDMDHGDRTNYMTPSQLTIKQNIMSNQFKSTKVSLPKKPGTFLVKIEIIREVDYVHLSDDNLDWEMPDDLPEDATVTGYTSKIPQP